MYLMRNGGIKSNWRDSCQYRTTSSPSYFFLHYIDAKKNQTNMSLQARVQNRLEELIQVGEKMKSTCRTVGGNTPGVISIPQSYVDHEQSHQWALSVLTILKSSIGEGSDNYMQVKQNLERCAVFQNFCMILSSLKAALDDLKGGNFFEAKHLIEAEVFGDLLEQAEELQSSGYKDAAAVLAGGVLEKHMRSMCASRGISLLKPNGKHKMINDLNDELAKNGTYNALKKKQVAAWADLRNKAAHGNFSEYSANDVAAFLRDVSDFCANFS